MLRLRGFLHALRLVEMTIYFYHHNKIRKSGFYFTFLWKISSTEWISSVKDGFHCVALLRLRGFLHAFHLVEMTIPPKKTSSQPKSCHSERSEESPGKVVLPCKKQLTKHRHLERGREIPQFLVRTRANKEIYTFPAITPFRAYRVRQHISNTLAYIENPAKDLYRRVCQHATKSCCALGDFSTRYAWSK